MNKPHHRDVLTWSVGFVLGSLVLCGPATAQSRRHMDLLACSQKSQRMQEEAEKALQRYMQLLVTQPKNAAWTPKTCEALRASIAASQRRIDWQGQGNRACMERFQSTSMQQKRADLQDSNAKKRKILHDRCG